MARTRKTDQLADDVNVQLRPEADEQPQVEDLPHEQAQPEPDEQPEPQGSQARWRGPALNRVELVGRIAKGPDVRVTPNGTHIAYFRVATNGREERDTEFHQCVAFGKTAEFIGGYLRIGRLVFIEGRLRTSSYDDQSGIRRWVTTIVANRLQALDQRRRDEQ